MKKERHYRERDIRRYIKKGVGMDDEIYDAISEHIIECQKCKDLHEQEFEKYIEKMDFNRNPECYYAQKIPDFVYDALTQEEMEEMKKHLNKCEECDLARQNYLCQIDDKIKCKEEWRKEKFKKG